MLDAARSPPTQAERQRLCQAMQALDARLAPPVGSKFPVVAGALVALTPAQRAAGTADVFVARNHELPAPLGMAQHAEERLWGLLQDAAIAPEQVRLVSVASRAARSPLFPCGGCRDYTAQWPHALFLAQAWNRAVPATEALTALRDLSPWAFHSPDLQARAAHAARVLEPDHPAQPLIAAALQVLDRSAARVDRGMLRTAMAIRDAQGRVLPAALQQISGRIAHAGALACGIGAAFGAGRITAVAVVGAGQGDGNGLFVPPTGQDLDFLAAAAADRPNLPIYLHNPATGATLTLTLQEMLPDDPNLWARQAAARG